MRLTVRRTARALSHSLLPLSESPRASADGAVALPDLWSPLSILLLLIILGESTAFICELVTGILHTRHSASWWTVDAITFHEILF